MPGKHIIVGTEPIHFDAFNTALNIETECLLHDIAIGWLKKTKKPSDIQKTRIIKP